MAVQDLPLTQPVVLLDGASMPSGAINGYVLQCDASGNFSWVSPGSVGQNVPGCRVTNTAATSFTTATDTVIPFAGERFDTDSMHDTVTNNSRITCKTPGLYALSLSVEWNPSTAGSREGVIRLNGTTIIAQSTGKATDEASRDNAVDVNTLWLFAAGDYVEAIGRQNSGGALALVTTTGRNEFSAAFLGGAGAIFSQTSAVSVNRSTNQSIPNSAVTAVSFDAENYDDGTAAGMHESVTNPTRLTCQVPGVYMVSAYGRLANSTTGVRQINIRLNGSIVVSTLTIPPSGSGFGDDLPVVAQLKMNVGDYVEVTIFQTSGGAVNFQTGNFFAAVMIRSNTSSQPQRVTTLPGTPYDGQEIYYVADNANGVIWHLRYNAVSTKWERVGGAPLGSGPSGSTSVSTTTLTALSGGPSFTIPVSGTYEVWGQCLQQQQVAGLCQTNTRVVSNGVATGLAGTFVGQAAFDGATTSFSGVLTLTAGQTLSLSVQNSQALSTTYQLGTLFIRPIKVG